MSLCKAHNFFSKKVVICYSLRIVFFVGQVYYIGVSVRRNNFFHFPLLMTDDFSLSVIFFCIFLVYVLPALHIFVV